jgi:hypothetical protein
VLCVSDVRDARGVDAVTLTIKAPEEARVTIEALFEAFLPPKAV